MTTKPSQPQEPTTATGRKVVAIHGDALLDDVLGIEAEARAQPDEPSAVVGRGDNTSHLPPDYQALRDAVSDSNIGFGQRVELQWCIGEAEARQQIEREAVEPWRQAAEIADKAASTAHDYIAQGWDENNIPDPQRRANNAIWDIHNALRPLLASAEGEK